MFQTIESKILQHLEMLIDNGYVEGISIIRTSAGFGYSHSNPRLTMQGYDLLDTMRSQSVWNTIKSTAKNKGIELTFETIKVFAGVVIQSFITK